MDSKPSDRETEMLFKKYLATTDSAEIKIFELLELANRNWIEGNFSSQIKKMQIALMLEKYVAKPCRASFHLNFTMGNTFREINVPYALHYYKKAISIGLRSAEPTDKFTVYNLLAGLYLKLNDHKNVMESYRKAMVEAVNNGTVAVSSVNNNIGWFYSQIGKNDSAMAYFQKALSYHDPNTTDDDLYSNILENVAKVEERAGNYEAALKIYRFNIDFYRREGRFFIGNTVNAIRVRSKLGSPGVKTSIDSLSNEIERRRDLDQKTVLGFYKSAYDHFMAKDDKAYAVRYHTKYDSLKDLIFKKDLEKVNNLTNALLSVQSLGFKSEYEVYSAELEAAKVASYKNKVIAILFLITAALIIIILAVYFEKRKKEFEITRKVTAAELKAKELEAKSIKTDLENIRLHSEAEIQRKEMERQHVQNELEKERIHAKAQLETRELEKKSVQNELELKKKDLTNMILHNTHLYEADKEIIDRLQKISRQTDLSKALKTFLLELKSRNQVAERLSSLQNNIDHLNSEFYHKLKIKFPQLTKAETELCGYILIDLSSKDISVLKSVEPSSVKMAKTRLRKKIGLNPEDNLLDFIRTI